MLGPVIGSIIYGYGGFLYTFQIFALLNAIGAVLIFKYIPSSLNKNGSQDEKDEEKNN